MFPRRVAYILNIFPKLSETFVAGELAELRRRGIQVRILSLLPSREELRHEIISRAGLNRLACYDPRQFCEIIRDFQPDLLHAHFATDATAKARELSLEFGIPYSFTAHGYDIHRKPPRDFFERAMAARAVITVSESNRDHIRRYFGVPRSRIQVIPCGVDTDEFSPNPAALPSDVPLIVCVARHVEVKNLGLLLQACSLLRDCEVPFRCLMIGDGPLRASLLAERNRLGLEAMVEMPGAASQAEVLKAWRQASVGVLTSHNEGMPVCLMEAAACGVPVVATWVGGVPELVQHGLTGLLCLEDNATDLARKLERLLTDQRLRDAMGQAARAVAVEKFSVTRQIDSLLGVWCGSVKEVCA